MEKAKNLLAEKVANVKTPEASVTDVDFKRVSLDAVEYLAKVSVDNPYGHPLPICEISYTLKSAGRLIPLLIIFIINICGFITYVYIYIYI